MLKLSFFHEQKLIIAKKGDETKSINSSDAAPSDPPPPIPPPLETCIDDVVPMSQFTPSNYTMIKNQAPVEFLTKSVEITPVLLDVDKSVFKVKQQRQQNPVSEKKEKIEGRFFFAFPDVVVADFSFVRPFMAAP